MEPWRATGSPSTTSDPPLPERDRLPPRVAPGAIVEWTTDAVAVFGTDGRIILWNRAAEWLYGHRPEEVIGQSALLLYAPDALPQARRIIQDVLDGARVVGVRSLGRHRDGRVLQLDLTYAPLLDRDQEVRGVVVTCRDAAEPWRRERELADLLDNAALGVHQVGPDGTVLYANRTLLHSLGYAPHEYIGQNVRQFYTPPEVVEQFLERLGNGERLTDEPATLRHKDGTLRHVRIDSTALIENGHFRNTRCFIRDVTAQRHIEEARAHLAAIAKFATDAIILRDLDGTIRSWNAGAEEMLGYTAQEMIGTDISRLLVDEDDEERRQWQPILQTGAPVDSAARAIHRDGHIVEVAIRTFPVRDAEGRLIGISKILRDTSQHHRQLEELRSYRARLDRIVEERTRHTQDELLRTQRSNDDLREFAEVAAHDLREPMRKIVQFGDLLQDELHDLDRPEALHHLERVIGAARRMGRLLDDLRDYVTVGEQGNTWAPVALQQVATDAVKGLQGRIAEAGATVQVVGLPPIDGDAVQMRHLFHNLLANALKFRRPDVAPSITISGGLTSDGYATIEVADNGTGFDQAHAQRIFRPFVRLQPTADGTGIGLAVARRIVERHGGSIEATASPGLGATFTVRLPQRQTVPAPEAVA